MAIDKHRKKIYERSRWQKIKHDERVKQAHREAHRRNKYGISAARYNEMMMCQGSVCKICRQPCRTHKSLSVDHSHETNQIRGLLCARCNQGLGLFREDPRILRRAEGYLYEYHGDAYQGYYKERTAKIGWVNAQPSLFDQVLHYGSEVA